MQLVFPWVWSGARDSVFLTNFLVVPVLLVCDGAAWGLAGHPCLVFSVELSLSLETLGRQWVTEAAKGGCAVRLRCWVGPWDEHL